jgi:hypothetical protein
MWLRDQMQQRGQADSFSTRFYEKWRFSQYGLNMLAGSRTKDGRNIFLDVAAYRRFGPVCVLAIGLDGKGAIRDGL